MSSEFWGKGSNKTEKMFYQAVIELGLSISLNPAIRSPYPVADKHGNLRKTVTTPDFLVRHTAQALLCYVEVTAGAGETPSKLAQLRVVGAAGVEHYVQLQGHKVQALFCLADLTARRSLLYDYLGWVSAHEISDAE